MTGSVFTGLLYSASPPSPILLVKIQELFECWIQSRFDSSLEKNLSMWGTFKHLHFSFLLKNVSYESAPFCDCVYVFVLGSALDNKAGWGQKSLGSMFLLFQTGFSPPQKPTHAKRCFSVLKSTCLCLYHTSYCLCPLRRSCPLLHSVTLHLQAHTDTYAHNCPSGWLIWILFLSSLLRCCFLWQPDLLILEQPSS